MKAKSVHGCVALLSLVMGFGMHGVQAADKSGSYRVDRDIYYSAPDASAHDNQSLDIYWRDARKRRPVIIYVHAGGWAFGDKSEVHAKPGYFVNEDMAFVSMNYRLRWDYKVSHQLEDIVSVVMWVRENADKYGLDPSRIILMGHAAGAHLVSLAGTNEAYLKARGLSLSDLKAVVAIDTESYDIPRLMNELGTFVQKRHHRVIFGEDEDAWIDASPITHVEADNDIPAFALLYLPGDEPSSVQASAFAKKLSDADVEVIMIPGNEKTRETLDKTLGREGDEPTQALITFIHAII